MEPEDVRAALLNRDTAHDLIAEATQDTPWISLDDIEEPEPTIPDPGHLITPEAASGAHLAIP